MGAKPIHVCNKLCVVEMFQAMNGLKVMGTSILSKSVITMETSFYNTNGSNNLCVLGSFVYIEPVKLLLSCDSGLIHYLKFKFWGGELIHT